MFMGTYTHAMDEKGRLIIPARIREELGEGFILTKNLDHCLGIYPAEGWKKFVEAVGTLPKISSEAARRLRRFYFGNSLTCEVDKQGRILIPGPLREFAGLSRDITMVGVDDHVEIWDTAVWNKYNAELDVDDLMDELGALNL
ncbi:MAG: division/cell wall cluster transcriptional repressor MraZ [Lachnospiraceae bacterium]|nr:division/cell wall cluster transcriptional repressor MraZ [Lachnospiraceae bacterium]MBP5254430.1 division/cell wall cluster transcriptional repressor MraZ [Lachnospiraceae bacterium]